MTSTAPANGPLVSIVTPTLNSDRFLEDTIRSVIAQEYAHVEYIVMDGGSSDRTLDILQQHAHLLRFVSAPDGGQADAVNRGFALTTGEILAFLNADDAYLPGAIAAAVDAFAAYPEAAVVYGEAMYVADNGSVPGPYPVEPFDRAALARRCFIC